jgi:hypothetical protein
MMSIWALLTTLQVIEWCGEDPVTFPSVGNILIQVKVGRLST